MTKRYLAAFLMAILVAVCSASLANATPGSGGGPTPTSIITTTTP